MAVLGDDGVVHGLEGDHVDQVVGDFARLVVVRADCGGICRGEHGEQVGGLAGEGFVGFLGSFLVVRLANLYLTISSFLGKKKKTINQIKST